MCMCIHERAILRDMIWVDPFRDGKCSREKLAYHETMAYRLGFMNGYNFSFVDA